MSSVLCQSWAETDLSRFTPIAVFLWIEDFLTFHSFPDFASSVLNKIILEFKQLARYSISRHIAPKISRRWCLSTIWSDVFVVSAFSTLYILVPSIANSQAHWIPLVFVDHRTLIVFRNLWVYPDFRTLYLLRSRHQRWLFHIRSLWGCYSIPYKYGFFIFKSTFHDWGGKDLLPHFMTSKLRQT